MQLGAETPLFELIAAEHWSPYPFLTILRSRYYVGMISFDSAVNTNRHKVANPLRLVALARFHTGPNKVHSEGCPVKRASYREERGASRAIPTRMFPVHF